jgi:hypothetical protein
MQPGASESGVRDNVRFCARADPTERTRDTLGEDLGALGNHQIELVREGVVLLHLDPGRDSPRVLRRLQAQAADEQFPEQLPRLDAVLEKRHEQLEEQVHLRSAKVSG